MKTKIMIFFTVSFLIILCVIIIGVFASTYLNPDLDNIDPGTIYDCNGKAVGVKFLTSSPVYGIIKDYTADNDIYTFSVKEYPDRVIIEKHYAYETDYSNKIRYYSHKGLLHNSLIYDITKNTARNLNEYPILRSSVINDNIKNIVYDISRSDAKNTELNVLFADGVYFDISEAHFLDVKKITDGTYMVIYKELGCVDYIHINNNKIVDEVYMIEDFPLSPDSSVLIRGSAPVYPVIGKILTDNIIRLEYKDGKIEHWKVRLTKEDIEKNKEYGLKRGLKNTGDNTLLWWNGQGKKSSEDPKRNEAKAWDYNEDTSAEPNYK